MILLGVLVGALVVWALPRLRRRGAAGAPRPPKRNRRKVARSSDPMAAVVASHSQAVQPHDAQVQELRLRAQANRVAADKHQRQADALTPDASDEARMQAQAHREAAAEHQRQADELEPRG